MYDVAIIGGGVIGCAIARELSRFRLATVLLERSAEVGFGTTKTNSGIIHAGHHDSAGSLKGRLVVRGSLLFDELERDLNFGFRRIGELVVARSEEETATLEKLERRGREKGVPGLEMWDSRKLRRNEPNLSHKLVAALHAPSAGVINPYEFAFALIENAVANGVELRVDSPVAAIEKEPEHLRVHIEGARSVEARFVLNCAGVFSDRVAAMVGQDTFTIRPRKGEEYMLDKRLEGLVRRLIFPVPTPKSKGILVIPTFDGTIMVGPTAEDTDDREDVATTYEGSEKVFDFVRRICPSITMRDTITEFAGLRAVADTNDFVIGSTEVDGFINVAGIQSPGLTASPAIAEHVVELLKDEGLKLEPNDSFDPVVKGPVRFAGLSTQEQNEKVDEDPLFGRVVCRCELVTEAEIHDAVDHGARTLDGIKFRSRAGMGRCQGGFCTARCMDILSERLRVPLTSVTKRGGDSWIALPMKNEQHPAAGEEEM